MSAVELEPGNNDDSLETSFPKRFSIKNEFQFDEISGKFKCNHCPMFLKKDKTGSTGNLSKHLQRAHKERFPGIFGKDDSQPTLFDTLRVDNVPTKVALEKKILNFIVMTSQPFSIVESSAFKALFPAKAIIPSKNTVRSRILAMYDEEKKTIKQKLKEIPGKISFILDCWKSKNGVSFHGIIATWISKNWTSEEILLDLDILSGSHTGVNLAQSFIRVLRDFEIPFEKVLGITTDNAANCGTMFSELEKIMQDEGIIFKSEDQRVRCLAHIINLACQASLKILKSSGKEATDVGHESDSECTDDESWDDDDDDCGRIDEVFETISGSSLYSRIRNSICKIRLSEDLTSKFREACEIFNIKYKKLILDVKTRWNSTYLMLRRVIELREPYESVLKKEKSLYKFELSPDDWNHLEEVTAFLKPFFEVTQLISKSKLPSMSLSAAIYIKLYNHVEHYNVKTHGKFLVEAAKAACAKLNAYYPSSDGLVYVTSLVLDPRCKLEWYSQVGIASTVVKQNKSCVLRLWDNSYKPPDIATNSAASESYDILASQMKRAKLSKDDFRRYLSLPVEDATKTDNILQWWKENEASMPSLAQMARDYLAVSGSGVPIERVFSYGTELLRVKRRIMKPHTTRIIFCLRAWMKYKEGDYTVAKMKAIASKCYG